MNKKQGVSSRVVLPTLFGSIFVIIVCVVLLAFYLPGWQEKLSLVEATRTAISAEETAQSFSSTKESSDVATQLVLENAQTLTAAPTITPSPTPVSTATFIPTPTLCNARVSGVDRAFYLQPGLGYSYDVVSVGSPVRVVGRLADRGWIKAIVDTRDGWLRSDSIKYDVDTCNSATLYTLSYLLGLEKQGQSVLLNDTFSSGENIWYSASGETYVPLADSIGEQQIIVDAQKIEVISSDNPAINNVQDFTLITSTSLTNVIDGESYIGVRFRDDDINYYEIRIYPGKTCSASLLASEQIINNFNMDKRACVNNAVYIEMSFDSNYQLSLKVNGYEVVNSFKFTDLNSQYTDGTVRLVVNESRATVDFITMVTP